MSALEERLRALGMPLPRPPAAIGASAPGVEHGGILYVSGTYGTLKD